MFTTLLFGVDEHKVLMSEKVPEGYDEEVYKKAIVLMTEGRLYLQEKYRKKITFVYQSTQVITKDAIEKELEKNGASFYVYLTVTPKEKQDNLEKCIYNLEIYNLDNKRSKTVKTKAIIRDKKIVQMEQGDIKSAAKQIAIAFK